MQIELVQMPLVDGDVPANTQAVVAAIGRAGRAPGPRLLVFPETTLSGFPTRANVAALAQTLDGPALTAVRDAARRAGVAVAVGLAERDADRHFNTTVLVDEHGELRLRYRKTHLWATDVGVFTPGDRLETCRWQGRVVGLLICFDIEFPENARALALAGADLLVVTNGNMDPYGPVHRRAIVARAMENQVFAAMANRCGSGADGLRFAGESALVDPGGEIVAAAADQAQQLVAALDPARLEQSRAHYRYLDQARIRPRLRRLDEADGRRGFLIEPDQVA